LTRPADTAQIKFDAAGGRVGNRCNSNDKLPLARQAIKLMLEEMEPTRIRWRSWSNAGPLAVKCLAPTAVSDKRKIVAAA